MTYRRPSVLVAAVLVASLVTGIGAAAPSQSGTEDNGLTDNESATLWSRDVDENSLTREAFERDGENRSSVHQVANGTDLTFKRPPDTAATWTRNDFEDLVSGGTDTAIYPPHARLENGSFIKDAHATIFAIHPSTQRRLKPADTPLYVAPNGTLRGFVDYRVRVPAGSSSENTTTEWSRTDHKIETVRLQKDGETIAEQDGTHTPALNYQIESDRNANLTLEAEIRVRLQKTTRINRSNETDVNGSNRTPANGSNETSVNTTYYTESRTVSDSIDVEVYHLRVFPNYAKYPNGDTGVAIFQSRPWQGYTLTEDGKARVRGVWRFYTARDTNWDTLVHSNRTASITVDSDAIPVYIHAYPSRIGPRAEPVRDGPEIIDTWGVNRSTPVESLDENINIDVVNQSYTATRGIAVRADIVDHGALRVSGIVRGVNTSVAEPDITTERDLRGSNLSVEIVQETESEAMLRIELRDEQTGDPIALTTNRFNPVGWNNRTGYITVGEQRVRTNSSGVATVTLDELGIYTVRYHPGSWLSQNPAYVRDTETVRWHPLATIEGWFALIIEVSWQLLPFVVMFYAGKRLLRMLGPEDIFQQQP